MGVFVFSGQNKLNVLSREPSWEALKQERSRRVYGLEEDEVRVTTIGQMSGSASDVKIEGSEWSWWNQRAVEISFLDGPNFLRNIFAKEEKK